MKRKISLYLFVLLASFALASCAGEDGEPGPQGEQGAQGVKGDKGDKGDTGDPGEDGEDGTDGIIKLGYLEGTVTGTRSDGTDFSETFKYEYTFDSLQGFLSENGRKILYVDRLKDPYADARFWMNLESTAASQLTPVDPGWSSYFSYYKELSNTQLFFLKVVPYFKATQAYLRELSLEQNLTYKFTQNWSNYGQLSYWPTTLWSEAESVDVYQFSVYTSGQSYNVYYRQDDGTLHAIKEVESNTYIYSGADFDKYDAIKFVYEAELDAHVFVDADSESPRYESVPAVPADTFVVSNYSHDPVTGILTFDFTISVSGTLSHGNRINSSKHDVTIEGTFNSGGKLYESVVGRKRT